MKTRNGALLVLSLVIAVVMTACSNGGGGGAPAAISNPGFSQGVMLKGSVIVNGVRFDDTLATIANDDATTTKTPAFLQDGMVVKVKGKRNDDGLTGTAEKVQVETEGRGLLTTIGTDTFEVHGQTVQVNGATVFAGVTNLGALTTADKVEVHGLRDANNVIQATRVEKVGLGAVDEVRGVITAVTGTGTGTFTIGSLTLNFSPTTTIVPPTSALGATSVGKLVQVHISGTTATTVKFEDLAEAEFEPAEGQEFEVEGFVSSFTTASSSFTVRDRAVSLSSSARFEGGLAADLVNGARVEAEGHLTGAVLVANKITFKESFKIKTTPTATIPDLVAMGITVKTNSKTQNTASTATLEIRGFLNLDGTTVTATRIKDGGGGSDFLQGLVTNIDSVGHTFKIAGVTVSAGAAQARPNDDNGTDLLTMDREAFFSSLASGRTVVKAKGTFSAGTLTATEIEIE